MDHPVKDGRGLHKHDARISRAYYILSILGVVLTVAAGVALWAASRPAYRVATSNPIGTQRAAMQVVYPADWSATLTGLVPAATSFRMPLISGITLNRRLPTGLQKWAEEHLYHITDKDWQLSEISIQLMPIPRFTDLDSEMARLQPFIRQLARSGQTYVVRKSTCPVGPLLEMDVDAPANAGLVNGHFAIRTVYPPCTPGEQQYEIVLRYTTPARLKDRVDKVARDVVSRIRLVRNSEPARLESVSRTNGTEN
jgi:hypothetical protein